MPKHHHHHHHHGHHHHHDNSCADESCYCCDEVCESEHHHAHEEGDFAAELLELADCAWMEVLREKIKDHITKTHGKHLDKLAQLVSETNNERWKLKMSKEKGRENFHEELRRFFHQSK
jgi:hypothetical protein